VRETSSARSEVSISPGGLEEQRPFNLSDLSDNYFGHNDSLRDHGVWQRINMIPGIKSRLFIDSVVGQTQVRWLVDTGASISVLDGKLFRKIYADNSTLCVPLQVGQGPVRGATGHTFHVLGRYRIPMTVQNKGFFIEVTIVNQLDAQAILGVDFLESYNAVINMNQGSVSLADNEIITTVTTTRNITVNAFSSKAVKVSSGNTVLGVIAGEHLLEGIYKADAEGCRTVMFVNDTALPKYVERGEAIGTFTSYNMADLKQVGEVLANKTGQPIRVMSRDKRAFIDRAIHLQVPPEWRHQFLQLIYEFHDVISDNATDLGRTAIISHEIRLKAPNPVHLKQFRIPWEHQQCVNDYVDKLLEKKCIQPSLSAFNAPVFCVQKPHGGGLRVVQDFRGLNLASYEDKYIIREVQDCIDQIGLRKSSIFTTLDLTSGFWQQNLDRDSRPYTAFTVPGRGRYEWCTTPMGLHGAPASFARLMDYVMRGLPGIITYIDDILAHAPSFGQHLVDLRQCFSRLRQYNLKLNLDKCQFGTRNVPYLGFTLTSDGVKPGEEKLAAVKNFPTPVTEKNIREFTGLANYFRHMIPNYALIAGHLTGLLTKESGWAGGPLPPSALTAFNQLKTALCEAPVLAYPRGDRPFSLATDAATGDQVSPGGLGAILTQKGEDGIDRVISYASRSLKPNEKNYSAFLLELAAATWAIDHYSVYLRGRKFTLFTDHKPLEKLTTRHQKTLLRLQEQMSEFQFLIKHRAGKDNAGPDALSRNAQVLELDEESVKVPQCFHLSFLKEQQRKDPLCGNLLRMSFDKTAFATASPFLRAVHADTFISTEDGLLRHISRRPGYTPTNAIVVPDSIKAELISVAHESRFGGHAGCFKTVERLRRTYWWPALASDVAAYISKCQRCAQCNNPYAFRSQHAPMQGLPVPAGPNVRVHMDLFGPLKVSGHGRKYILVITDAYTKYAVLVPLPNKEAATVAAAVFKHWICVLGCPSQFVSDRGTEFVNDTIKTLYNAFGIKQTLTSAMHPQTNSACESFNRTIIKYLQRMLESDSTLEWEDWLPALSLSYNTQVHKTTLTSPFYLMYLREPNLPYFDIDKPVYSNSWPEEALHRLRQTYKLAATNAAKARNAMQIRAARTDRPLKSFKIGEEVLVHFPRSHFSGNAKLARQWTPGWRILEQLGPVTYRLKPMGRRGLPTTVHLDRLKAIPATPATVSRRTQKTQQQQSQQQQPITSDTQVTEEEESDQDERAAQPRPPDALSESEDEAAEESDESSSDDGDDDEPPPPPAPLARLAQAVFGGRQTRSRGPVAELPRVLDKTIDPTLGRRTKKKQAAILSLQCGYSAECLAERREQQIPCSEVDRKRTERHRRRADRTNSTEEEQPRARLKRRLCAPARSRWAEGETVLAVSNGHGTSLGQRTAGSCALTAHIEPSDRCNSSIISWPSTFGCKKSQTSTFTRSTRVAVPSPTKATAPVQCYSPTTTHPT
jgi:transposase InsO family protein